MEKNENNTFNNVMRSKRFSEFTFIRNAQSQTFEIRGCIRDDIKSSMKDKKLNSHSVFTDPHPPLNLIWEKLIYLYGYM